MAGAIGVRGDYDAARLRELAKRSGDANQTRRLLALAAIYDGGSRTEAAKMGCVGLQTVRDWVLAFNAEGRNVDYRAARGLDRALFQALTAGRWIEEAQNLIIEGPASAKAGWPVHSATRRAATIARCSISARPACSAISRSPAATAATLA